MSFGGIFAGHFGSLENPLGNTPPTPTPAPGAFGSSETAYGEIASARLGTNLLDSWYMDFINGSADEAFSLTAGGGASTAVGDSADPVNAIGGISALTTGANPTGAAQVLPVIATNFSPLAAYGTSNIRFYRACRFQMATAPTADTIAFAGSLAESAGVFGANSTTRYSMRIRSNAVGGQQYITSTVAIDTLWHVLEHWWDGTSFWFSVDGETPISLSGLGLFPISNATENYYTWMVAKLGGAVDHHASWDWILWTVVPQ